MALGLAQARAGRVETAVDTLRNALERAPVLNATRGQQFVEQGWRDLAPAPLPDHVERRQIG